MEWRVESTPFVSRVFEGIAPATGLKILDLGAAEPESVTFYNRVGGQICLLDTIDQLRNNNKQPYALRRELPERAKDCQFDICLLWDCLNYFNGPALRKFGKELSNHIHRHTRVHLFAAYTPIRAFQSHRYALLNFRNLTIKPRDHLVPWAHPKSEVDKALVDLRPAHTVLRPGNRLEMTLIAS